MNKFKLGSSALALAAALAVGACSSGSNRDSTAGTSGGDVGTAGSGAASTSGAAGTDTGMGSSGSMSGAGAASSAPMAFIAMGALRR